MNRYFDVAWWATVVGIFAVGLLPYFAPAAAWPWVGLAVLWGFVVLEYASKAVGRSTLTAWVHQKLRAHRYARIALGVFFALVALIRLPSLGFGLHIITGVFLFAWLPPHYSEPGFRGMVDEFFHRALGVRLW